MYHTCSHFSLKEHVRHARHRMPGQPLGKRGVVGDGAAPAMSLETYQKAICDEWFTSSAMFIAKAMLTPVVSPAASQIAPPAGGSCSSTIMG